MSSNKGIKPFAETADTFKFPQTRRPGHNFPGQNDLDDLESVPLTPAVSGDMPVATEVHSQELQEESKPYVTASGRTVRKAAKYKDYV
jgi:hypothetical protein